MSIDLPGDGAGITNEANLSSTGSKEPGFDVPATSAPGGEASIPLHIPGGTSPAPPRDTPIPNQGNLQQAMNGHPITPAAADDEQTIELTPQQQKVLRYLARRHMRNVHITRRIPSEMTLEEGAPAKAGASAERSAARFNSSHPPSIDRPNVGADLSRPPPIDRQAHKQSRETQVTGHATADQPSGSEEIRQHPPRAIAHLQTQPLKGISHLKTQLLRDQPAPGRSLEAQVGPMEPLMPNPLHKGAIRPGELVYSPYRRLSLDARRKRRYHLVMLRHRSRKHLRLARVQERQARRRLSFTVASSILSVLVVLLSLASAGAVVAYNFVTTTQQTYEQRVLTLRDLLPPDNLKIFDSKGLLVGQLTDNGIHTNVKFDQIAPDLINATVASEDKNFWSNEGVDLYGIIRAAITDLQRGRVVEGGSTITQQLIKNLVVGDGATYIRKLEEVILAPQLNSHYSKRDILEMYLNSIYYGHQAYGIDAAATVYFGLQDSPTRTAAQQLDLAQAAMLAGLPSNPSTYDPAVYFSVATVRFESVLGLLVNQHYISRVQAQDALREEQSPHFFKMGSALHNRAPHFMEFVLNQLQQMFHLQRSQLSRSGMLVYTTLDIGLQDKIQKIMQRHIAELRDAHHLTNAAEVLIDFHTGAILSLLGSINYNDASIDGQFDVATSYRQPGSSFKPYVYVTAFEQGYSPAQAIDDAPTSISEPGANPPIFTPTNYDLHFHGHMTLRCALQNSLNVPAVKVLEHVGIDSAMQMAYNMGITSYQGTPGYSLVLGGLGIRLVDHTSAMGVFANGGVRVPYYTINKIVSGSTGQVLFSHQRDPGKRVISPQLAYMMTNVLSDNASRTPEFYDCNVLQLYSNSQQDCWEGNRGVVRPAAAKTGTTQNFRDNWTVGYTTDFVMGVWAGNDDNMPMINVTGVQGAAPIWHDSMLLAEQGHPIRNFSNPGGLKRSTVTYPDGVRTTDWFLPGTVPTFATSPTPTSPAGSPTPGPGPSPSPEPGGGNSPGPVPAPYCPSSYSFVFAPPPDNIPSADNGWW